MILAVVGKRRQEPQSAVFARHVPRFAVAQMGKKTLIVAVQHDADVRDAGAVHIREHEVNGAVASAERQ